MDNRDELYEKMLQNIEDDEYYSGTVKVTSKKDAAEYCTQQAIQYAIDVLNDVDSMANNNYYRASIEKKIEELQSLLKQSQP